MDRMDNKPVDNKTTGKSANINTASTTSTANSASSSLDTGARDAKNLVNQAKGMASDMYAKIQDRLPENFDQQVDVVKQNAKVALDKTESIVRQYPLYSVLGAAAIGVLFGSLLSGSRSGSSESVYEQ